MTLPASGAISFANVNVELGRSSTAALNLNEGSATVLGPRFLAGKFSGAIAVSDLYAQTLFTVTGGSTTASGSGFRIGAGSSTVTSSLANVAGPGGLAGGNTPQSFLWEYVSGDTLTVTSLTSSSTTFSKLISVPALGESNTVVGVYRCRVTDAASRILYGPNCTVTLTLTESS
jgi:hypothetical protein